VPLTSRAVVLVAALAAGCGGGSDADAGPPVDAAPCVYPEASGRLGVGETIPPFRWNGVRTEIGETTDFDLRDFHCSSRYDAYDSVVLVVGAGWCSACPAYIRGVDAMSSRLLDEGAMILYLEVETADFEPATSVDAAAFVDGLIMDGPGLRMGDADNTIPSAVRPLVSQMPSAYFIRRRDMRIVADQKDSIYVIDFPGLAADPEQTWTPTPPPFEARCTAADEEPGEPNDTREDASPIAWEEEIAGGLCAEGSDFYFVDRTGPWRFSLYSTVFDGNLDLRLYDRAGSRIGGSTQASNHDWVDYDEPAYVEVYGESNTYRVTLVAPP
jgi:hypothetical protein